MTRFTSWLRRVLFLAPAKDRWIESDARDNQDCDPIRLKLSVRNAQQFGNAPSIYML